MRSTRCSRAQGATRAWRSTDWRQRPRSRAQDGQGQAEIDLSHVERALQERHLLYDRAGDQHYYIVSALIKSIRGSDPDAAVYWLARMLEAGEDVLFVARRLVISAAEDVGLADPQALQVAIAVQTAAHFVGMAEGGLALSYVSR